MEVDCLSSPTLSHRTKRVQLHLLCFAEEKRTPWVAGREVVIT